MADGLFGPSPWEIQQAQQHGLRQQAAAYAKQSPMERAAAGMYQAGGMLGGMGAEALGMKNVAVENARRTEQIMGEGDTDLGTSAGMAAKAEQFRKAGDLRTATALTMKANAMKLQEAAAALAGRKQDTLDAAQLSLTKLQTAQAEKANALAERALRTDELKNLPPEVQAMMALEKMPPESSTAKSLRQWIDNKIKGKGEWSEPYNLSGATVQKNLSTGEIRTAVSRAPVTNVNAGPVKPKGLGREAGLKWELDHGFITQDTYDMAMVGTAGGKVKVGSDADQKKALGFLKAAEYDPESGTDAIEKLIMQSTSGAAERIGSAAASAFGVATKGNKAITTLAAASNAIVMEMMGGKLGAGVSNADRDFIEGQLGKVADPNIPAESRLAAWRFARERMIQVGILPQSKGASVKQQPPTERKTKSGIAYTVE